MTWTLIGPQWQLNDSQDLPSGLIGSMGTLKSLVNVEQCDDELSSVADKEFTGCYELCSVGNNGLGVGLSNWH